jgi:hypothetical protein
MTSGVSLNAHPLKTIWECVSCQCSPILGRNLLCMKIPKLRSLVLLITVVSRRGWARGIGWIILARKDRCTWNETCPRPLRLPQISHGVARDRNNASAVWDCLWGLKFIEGIIKVHFLPHREQITPSLQTGSINAVLRNKCFILKNRLKHTITVSAKCGKFH